jgi:hypothetical protein
MVTNELKDLIMQYLSHETQKSEDCYDIILCYDIYIQV